MEVEQSHWEQFHLLCDQSLNIENFNIDTDLIADFTSSLIDISNKCIPKTSTNPKKSKPWYNDDCKGVLDSENKHYQGSANMLRKKI